MIILGITAPISWNSAAAIVKDGQLLAAAEEERFNGLKHSPRILPLRSIEFCLSFAKVKPEDVDAIGVGFQAPLTYYSKTFLENLKEGDLERALREGGTLAEYLVGMARFKDWLKDKGFRTGGENKLKLKFYPHHLAHAASAYRCSGFDQANIITLDGQGENDSGSIWKGEGGKMAKMESIGHHQSLGWVYSAVTDVLGFLPHSHEGKVMGLAGWGKRKLPDSDLWAVNEEGYELKTGWKERLWERFGPRRGRYEELTDKNRNLALTVQRFTEQAGVALAKRAYKRNKANNVCLAGGVALNCDMNGKIWDLPFVENIFIQPASSDAGTAIGSALELADELGENADFEMNHAYWGPDYNNEEIETVLKESKLNYERVDRIEEYAAKRLAKGEIIGWFQGRSEIGPRALGNRSILAHPGLKGIKDKVNREVKHRETWRPFAPSVLDEAGEDYFEHYCFNPFMILTFEVKKKGKKDLSQAMHVDNTARVQSVEPKTNSRYYKLISEFGKITGIPGVLNTSFNDAGQPLVNSPKEALRTFAATGIDILAIGDFIVEKKKN